MTAQIQGYLRALALRRPGAERVGPFIASYDPHSDNPFRNYALPDDGAAPSPAEVGALIDAFARRQRTPRLEYVPAASPAVEAALLDAGFVAEGRFPLMTATRATARPQPPPPGIELLLAATDAELRGVVAVQHIAYDDPAPPSEHDIARQRTTIAQGGLVALARDTASGEAVGAGLCTPPLDGITEIAAIGVIPAYRRRGVAGALTALLLREAFAAGLTAPFLMPAEEAGERIYARVGFARVSEVLMISRAAASAD